MASAFGHALAGLTLGKLAYNRALPAKFWILSLICAVIPDADVIGFHFGVSYDSIWGHRGFTHSLLFAAVLSMVVVLSFYRERSHNEKFRLCIYFFLVTASHGFLDAFTDGGRGVGFFIPFSPQRYFFPWRPIRVSPVSIQAFMSLRGLRVLQNEAMWIGFPCVILLWANKLVRRR